MAVSQFTKHAVMMMHKLGLRMGICLMPMHYYISYSNIVELATKRQEWAKRSELPGVKIDLEAQKRTLRESCLPYQKEYSGNKRFLDATKAGYGLGYSYIDAQALHGFVRHNKPRRVVEVGSGVSTWCMLGALEANQREDGKPFELNCIEPFPSAFLSEQSQIKLHPNFVQRTSLDLFTSLQAGDFLFIDSTHAVKPDGDVNFLMLEVLPRLAPGVLVHIHDIYLPYDYPPDFLDTFLQWMETSLVRAFLIGNSRSEILFCMSLLHYDAPQTLKDVFPEYEPQPSENGLVESKYAFFAKTPYHFPSSLYLRV